MLLNEVAGWEKVKKDTSIPVQKAARAFRLAKNDEEAANAMTELTKSCINYIEKNGGNILKSGKRKRTVHAILSQIVLAHAKKELDAYEKSLKDRKMPGYMIKGDPYGINLYRTHLDGLMDKDDKGNLQYDEEGKLKVKNIMDMPEPDLKTGEFM